MRLRPCPPDPRRSLSVRAALGAAAALVALAGAPSLARADGDAATAQALFDEAMELKNKEDWAKACPKFESSYKLDPALGTRLNLGDYKVSQDIVKLVPRDLCLRYRLMPIDVLGKNLTLAMVNPLDDAALAAIQQACPEYRLKPFLCSLSDFDLVASRMLRSDEEVKSDGQISLQSLGMAGTTRKTEMPPSVQPRVAPPIEDFDPTATKLFDGPAAAPRRSSGPLPRCGR